MDRDYWRTISVRIAAIYREIEAIRDTALAEKDHETIRRTDEPLPGLWALLGHADHLANREARNQAAS
jgi:hypothetical protein